MSKQTTHLTVRVSPELRTEFNKRSYLFGKPADVLRQLIEAFVDDLKRAGVTGVHVITSRGARNVRFYERCGFHEAGARGAGEGEVVFLARDL